MDTIEPVDLEHFISFHDDLVSSGIIPGAKLVDPVIQITMTFTSSDGLERGTFIASWLRLEDGSLLYIAPDWSYEYFRDGKVLDKLTWLCHVHECRILIHQWYERRFNWRGFDYHVDYSKFM